MRQTQQAFVFWLSAHQAALWACSGHVAWDVLVCVVFQEEAEEGGGGGAGQKGGG